MTRPSLDFFESSSTQSGDERIEAFSIFYAIFEHKVSAQIEVVLTCTSSYIMTSVRLIQGCMPAKKPGQDFQTFPFMHLKSEKCSCEMAISWFQLLHVASLVTFAVKANPTSILKITQKCFANPGSSFKTFMLKHLNI